MEPTPKPSRRSKSPKPGDEGTFEFSPVFQATVRDVVVAGGDSGEPIGGDGFFGERSVIGIPGTWSNVSLHFVVPFAWVDPLNTVEVLIYSVVEGASTLQARVRMSAASFQLSAAADRATGSIHVRGVPSQQWDVRARCDLRAGRLTDGVFTAFAWGTESTPEHGSEAASKSISDAAHPVRASLTEGLDVASGRFVPITVTTTGPTRALDVRAAGGSFSGSVTPVSPAANRSDTVPVWAFPSIHDPVANNWKFLDSLAIDPFVFVPNPSKTVPVGSFSLGWNQAANAWSPLSIDGNFNLNTLPHAFDGEDGAGNSIPIQVDNSGNLFVRMGVPDPSAAVVAPGGVPLTIVSPGDGAVIKASTAYLFKATFNFGGSVVGNGPYFQIHNSAVIPAAGAVPKWSTLIAIAGQFVTEEWVVPIRLPAGLAWVISSTAATYTPIGGLPATHLVSASFSYV